MNIKRALDVDSLEIIESIDRIRDCRLGNRGACLETFNRFDIILLFLGF